jgi:hypothetical protein
MTKILNSLKVTGTGSSKQAIGVTGGYVSINDKLRIGDWSTPTATVNINSKGTTSSTNAFKITTGFTTNNFYPSLNYSDDGVLTLVGAGLGYGATNSGRPIGSADLVIGNNGYGSIDLQGFGLYTKDNGNIGYWFSQKTNPSGTTYSYFFNFVSANGRYLSIGAESDLVQSISFPYNNEGYIRLNAGNSSTRFLRLATDNTSGSYLERFGIQGAITYSNAYFNNTYAVSINNGSSNLSPKGIIDINPITATGANPKYFYYGATYSPLIVSRATVPTNDFLIDVYGNYLAPSANNIAIGSLTSSTGTGFEFNVGNQDQWNLLKLSSTSGGTIFNVSPYIVKIGGPGLSTTSGAKYGLIFNSGKGNNIGIDLYGNQLNNTQFYNGVGLFGTSSYGGGILMVGPDNSGASLPSGRITRNIFSGWVGINTLSPTALFDINNYATNSTPTFVIRGGKISATASITVNSVNPGDTIVMSVTTPTGVPTFSVTVGTLSTPNSIASSLSSSINYWSSSVTGLYGTLLSNVINLTDAFERGSGLSNSIVNFTITGTSSITTTPFTGGVTPNNIITALGNGRVGVGINSPTTLLHIYGTTSSFRLQDGSQGAGYVLTSDANGNASWGTSSGNGVSGGSASYVALFTSSTGLTPSNMYQGTLGTILIGYTSSSSTYTNDTNVLRVKGDVYFDNATATTKKFFINGAYLFDDYNYNIALGLSALGGNGLISGNWNIAVGYQSLNTNTSGTDNIGIGYQTLKDNNANFNLAIGRNSLSKNTTGTRNLGLGYYSLGNNLTGVDNLAIGYNSLSSGLSQSNVAIGSNTLLSLKTGSFNIAIGKGAATNLGGLTGSSDSYNIIVGNAAAIGLTQGNYNTIISSNTGTPIGFTQGNYNTFLGYGITGTTNSNQNNTVIGSRVTISSGVTNSIILADGTGNQRIFVNNLGYVGIGTQSPTALLTLNSPGTYSLRLVDGRQGLNRVLISDANGYASWATASETTYYAEGGLTQSGKTFSVLLPSGSGLTSSLNGLTLDSQILSISSDFTVGDNENGYLYYVTTGTTLITCTTPTYPNNGFQFTIMKVDSTNGVIQVPGVYEYSGSSNLSYITRSNETITYKYDGSSWIPYVVDDGIIPPSTMLANMGATYGHAEEFPVLDINDTIQGAINYNQGGWNYDWLSGTIFSAYSPLTLSNVTTTSIFNTASNSFIGSTSSPLTISAYSLTLGKSIRVLMTGTVSGTNSLTIYPKIGTQTFSSTLISHGPSSNYPWRIEYEFKVLAVGSSGKLHGSGFWLSSLSLAPYQNIMGTSSYYTTVDTTVDNTIDFLMTASNSYTIIHSTVERLA